ncbi:hypothetical protein HDU76_005741, partial [Blyttiomyces sp. JEL0837]
LRSGKVQILDYFVNNLNWVDRLTSLCSIKHQDAWEWIHNTCQKFNLEPDTVLLIKDIEGARTIIRKLGPNCVDAHQLHQAATMTNFETFAYLWDHRRIDFWDDVEKKWGTDTMVEFRGQCVDSSSAMLTFIEDSSSSTPLSLSAMEYYYNHSSSEFKAQRCKGRLENALQNGNLDIIDFLLDKKVVSLDSQLLQKLLWYRQFHAASYFYAKGCRFSVEEASDEIDFAAGQGNLGCIKFISERYPEARCSVNAFDKAALRSHLHVVKFLLDHCFEGLIESAFLNAAGNGDLDMVKFFVEKRMGECDFKQGMLKAMKSRSFSDLWTRFLNGRLSIEEIQTNATELWNAAFDQDWSGDLTILPKDGLPTALNGLCKVKSRFMYDRLCKLRPDLAGITDSLKVYLRSNHRYGYFTEPDFRPVILLEDDDEIESGRTADMDDSYRKLELQHVSRTLGQQIPQAMVEVGRQKGHYDFVVRMVDALGTVNVEQMLRSSLEFMEDIGETGNLDLLRYMLDRFILTANDNQVLVTAVRRVIKGAMITGQLSTLYYIQQRFEGNTIFPEFFQNRYDEETFTTEYWDCWEWNIDICNNLDIASDTLLGIKNLKVAQKVVNKLVAQKVVNKLGEHSISTDVLLAASQHVNMETFNYLWAHREEEVLDDVMEMFELTQASTVLESEMGSEAVLFKVIEESMEMMGHGADGGVYNLDVIRCYYERNPTSEYLGSIMFSAAAQRNCQVVDYLHSKGVKTRNESFIRALEAKEWNIVQFLSTPRFRAESDYSFYIEVAAHHGNLETVKFLHRNCCEDATGSDSNDGKPCSNFPCTVKAQQAFLYAARRGDYDMVVYFLGQGKSNFDLERGLLEAVTRGRFRLVRYFYDLGVSELKDDTVKAVFQEWLEGKLPTNKLAEFVREHFFGGMWYDAKKAVEGGSVVKCVESDERGTHLDVESKATELWNQAFEQDWDGDLQLLPANGLPTVLTGLCKVRSRSMYDRLNKLRPDLAGFTDTLKVFIRANHRFGYFTTLDSRPIVLLEDDDEIELLGRRAGMTYSTHLELKRLSAFLINIAMRLCWMEDLEPWITKYPVQFFLLALRTGHHDLVVRMVDGLRIVDIEQGEQLSLKYMEDIVEHGNLDLLQYLLDRFFRNANSDMGILSAVEKIITAAMTNGQLCTLQYIQQHYQVFVLLSIGNVPSQKYETEHLDCWLWYRDINCNNLDIASNTLLVIKNLKVAQNVVKKLGEHSMSFEVISAAFQYVNVETFKYLWSQRHPDIFNE